MLYYWIIGILLTVIGALLGRLLYSFDKLIETINRLREKMVEHRTQLDYVDKRFSMHENTLKEYGTRIQAMEKIHAPCKNYENANK